LANDRMIGRESELQALETVLASARPGLILLVGGPRTGKGRLLRELRARAGRYLCVVTPHDVSADPNAPWLVVDKQLTVEEFRRATAAPGGAEIAEHSHPHRCELLLVYGYRPEEDFHYWFAGEYVPEGAKASPPRVVVVAGGAGDVAGLESLADLKVILGPLPREAVTAELRALDAAIPDRLAERELEIYADAIVADPSVIEALRHLLPLTPASKTAKPVTTED
jgi:hypothetical protein